MKMYRFEAKAGEETDQFGSVKAIISKMVQMDANAAVNLVYIRPMERIISQEIVAPQLLLLAQGEGWVRNGLDEMIPIKEGQAVFWEQDEWHESGTETGMTAVIIEGENFDPVKLTPLLQKDGT